MPYPLKVRFQDVMPDGATNRSEAAKNGIFFTKCSVISQISWDMWLFVIHAITNSVNGFLMTETGDLERRIWLSNVRKLYQPLCRICWTRLMYAALPELIV